MNPAFVGNQWRKRGKALEPEGWHLRELCHSHLFMLAAQGHPPKVMQRLAGHFGGKRLKKRRISRRLKLRPESGRF